MTTDAEMQDRLQKYIEAARSKETFGLSVLEKYLGAPPLVIEYPKTEVPKEAPKSQRSGWIQSYAGKVVTPAELQVSQVSFGDIPHALAQKVRFTGHLRDMGYSVAQHCCIGSDQILGPFKAAFLLHEVSECYLPDIASPLKPLLSVDLPNGKQVNWEDLEEQHAKVIFEALGHSSLLPLIYSSEVKRMDLQMLMTEKRDFMGPEPEAWNIDATPLDITLGEIWSPARAKQEFITRYERLFGRGA